MRSAIRVLVAVTLVAAAGVGIAGSANANRGNSERTIRIQDDCDPETFNAALGDGACVGDGDTTLDELIEQLVEDGDAPKWRFHPHKTHVKAGERLRLVNQGGEPHTFTKVKRFGPGCVPELNEPLGLTGPPAADCAAAFAAVLPGGGAQAVVGRSVLRPGVNRFECMIHPWMTATVTVRKHH
jgi:plastocyanin